MQIRFFNGIRFLLKKSGGKSAKYSAESPFFRKMPAMRSFLFVFSKTLQNLRR